VAGLFMMAWSETPVAAADVAKPAQAVPGKLAPSKPAALA